MILVCNEKVMHMRKYFIILLLALSFDSYSQKMSIGEVCKLAACSSDTKIIVKVTKDSYFDGVWPKRPYYFENVGSIVMGEILSFEAISDKKGNLSLKYIPAKTKTSINIKLYQPGDKKDDIMTVALLENGSKFNIVYKGGIFHTMSGKYAQTSVCSVLSGKSAFESWPYAISMFTFSNLKVVSQKDALAYGCK